MDPTFGHSGSQSAHATHNNDDENRPPSVFKVDHFCTVTSLIQQEKSEDLLPLAMKKDPPLNLMEDPVLNVVIEYKKTDLAKRLIQNMPPVEPGPLWYANYLGDTALHVAATVGDLDVTEALLRKNSELVSARNRKNETPLHKAALYGHETMFWDLVKIGSHDPYERREDGATVLHCAIMGSAPALALKIAKAYPNLITSRNDAAVTPLQLMVTIPGLFRSRTNLGPLEAVIYKLIPYEDSGMRRVVDEEQPTDSSDGEGGAKRVKRKILSLLTPKTFRSKFPSHYSSLFDLLEFMFIPARWVHLLLFRILKQLFPMIERLEKQKKTHKETLELIEFLAYHPEHMEFYSKGRREGKEESLLVGDITSSATGQSPPSTDAGEGQEVNAGGNRDQAFDKFSEKLFKYMSHKDANHEAEEAAKELQKSMKEAIEELQKSMKEAIEELQKSIKEAIEAAVAKELQKSTKVAMEEVSGESTIRRWDEPPLILGAQMGLPEFVRTILLVCPQAAAYLDTKGRSVLQVAIENGNLEIVETIREMTQGNCPILPSWLLSKVENKTKRTILHFASAKGPGDDQAAVQMQDELIWFEMVRDMVPRELVHYRNDAEKTAQEMFSESHKEMAKACKEQLVRMGQTCSGLLAAVVFASSFSIPGEKDPKTGNPIYFNRLPFRIFSHAFVIGLSSAATSLVLFLSLLVAPYKEQQFRRAIPIKYFFACLSFGIALTAFLVAFTCNIYLQTYGGQRSETNDLIMLLLELLVFPIVCCLFLLSRGSYFLPSFGSLWR